MKQISKFWKVTIYWVARLFTAVVCLPLAAMGIAYIVYKDEEKGRRWADFKRRFGYEWYDCIQWVRNGH